MKKSEKDALKKAFNIPEPKHKNSFVLSYNEMLKKNEKNFNVPVFFRWTSTAVFAALIIGLWSNLSQNTDFRDKFTDDNSRIITENTTASTDITTEVHDTDTVVSSVVSMHSGTTYTTAISQTTKKSESTVNIKSTTSASRTEPKQNGIQTEKSESSIVTETAIITSTDKITTVRTIHTTAITNTNSNATSTIKTTAPKTETVQTTTKIPDFPVSVTTTLKTTVITTTEIKDPVIDITTDHNNFEPPPVSPSVPVTTTIRNTDAPSFEGNNYIVTPSANYKKSSDIIDIKDIFENCSKPNQPNDNILTFQQLYNNSDYIVKGVIDEIIYTEVNGMPYTQENITIYGVYKGDKLIPMDKISVYVAGGYMPITDFSTMNNIDNEYSVNYSVYDSGGNKSIQNIGDILLFCIKDGTSSMPDGAFMLTEKNDISVFRYENNEYISLGNENLRFKTNDLLNI